MKLQNFGRLSAAILATMLATAALAQDAATQATPTPAATAVAEAPAAASEQASVGPVLTKKEWAPKPTFEPLAEETEAVRINGDVKTIKDLKLLLNLRNIGVRSFNPDKDVPRLRGEDLRHIASHSGAYDLMAKQARERKLTLDADAMKQLTGAVGQVGNGVLYKQIVVDKLKDPTDEEMKKYYEERKESDFRIKEELQLRHIFASAYVTYEVKPGDTLESIAKAIGGDEAQAPKILADATKKPRIEGLKQADKDAGKEEDPANPPEKRPAPEQTTAEKDAEGKELPPRALVAGEKLLVPTVGEQAKAAEGKIKEAHEALKKGEKFEDVAKKFSESENPGILMTVRPEEKDKGIMPELKAAFMALADGAYSEPIRTKHGYQIVSRVKYTAPGYQDFETVKQNIALNLKNTQTKDLIEKFFNDLVADPAVVSIDTEKLNAKEDIPDDVLVTIGGTQVTRKDLSDNTRGALDKPENKTPEGFRKLLWQNNYTQAMLLDGYRKTSKIDEKPEMVRAHQAIEDTLLAQAYLTKVLEEKGLKASEEEIKNYYEANRDKYVESEKFDILAMTVAFDTTASDKTKAGDEAVAKLTEAIKGIQSVEEFRQKAKELNPPELQAKSGEVGKVEARNFPEDDAKALRAVKAPGITEVLRQEDRAVVYWLKEVTPERTMTLEEKRPQIERLIVDEARKSASEELLETYRREAKVDVLVPDEPAATPAPAAPAGT